MSWIAQLRERFGAAFVTALQVAALLPVFALAAVDHGPQIIVVFVAALICALGPELVFAALRKRPWSGHGVTTALIIACLVSPDTPLWQLAFCTVLGVIVGELIFGGRGFGFISPAVVVLALLLVSAPGTALLLPSAPMTVASAVGGAFLLTAGLLHWRVLVALLVAAAIGFALKPAGLVFDPFALGIVFAAVFLIADPFASAQTKWGQWLQGALAGALAAWLAGASDGPSVEVMVRAALLASLFAPLFDSVGIQFANRLRSMRHG